jgi:hypothetical protein
MKATPGVAEPFDEQPLDEAMHVFVGTVHERRVRAPAFEDVGQGGGNVGAFLGREDSRGRQGASPRHTADDVVLEQPAIEGERRAPFEGGRVGSGVEAARPEVGGHR